MFTVSEAIPINVPGRPHLTRSDVWAGLVEKSNDAVPFVEAMSYCVVTNRISDLVFDRDIVFHGEEMAERIFLEPEKSVTFARLSGSVLGTIWNTIEQDAAGELFLRFTFALAVHGIDSNSQEERDYAGRMKAGYIHAVTTTLDTIRKRIEEGGIQTAR